MSDHGLACVGADGCLYLYRGTNHTYVHHDDCWCYNDNDHNDCSSDHNYYYHNPTTSAPG